MLSGSFLMMRVTTSKLPFVFCFVVYFSGVTGKMTVVAEQNGCMLPWRRNSQPSFRSTLPLIAVPSESRTESRSLSRQWIGRAIDILCENAIKQC
jgi:hypothetical protein